VRCRMSSFSLVSYNGKLWIAIVELVEALGYASCGTIRWHVQQRADWFSERSMFMPGPTGCRRKYIDLDGAEAIAQRCTGKLNREFVINEINGFRYGVAPDSDTRNVSNTDKGRVENSPPEIGATSIQQTHICDKKHHAIRKRLVVVVGGADIDRMNSVKGRILSPDTILGAMLSSARINRAPPTKRWRCKSVIYSKAQRKMSFKVNLFFRN
jgi:hypothetical protein